MRKFEKISKEKFDEIFIFGDYNNIKLPQRATTNSAGYDFFLINNLKLLPLQEIRLNTGIKCCMNPNEVLMLFPRSSLGFNYYTRFANTVPIIDADYYNNPKNEGHIMIKIRNEGTELLELQEGTAIAQGVFLNYLVTDDDPLLDNKRLGGIGSTSDSIH